MSIYWKDCPHCGSNQPVSTLYCACGYCFDPDQLEGTIEALELQAHEEQLYYEYLNARLNQAQGLNHAAAGAANPTDRYFDALAADAAAMLQTVESELALQSRRVAEARERVEQARRGGTGSVRDRPAPELRAHDPAAGFRALQSRKAALAVENSRLAETFSCPRCTAALPAGSTRCGLCGCGLSDSRPLPSGLIGAARAALRPRRPAG